jgi:hypothetical protein
MDNATLEILLNKVESDTLDFKAQQYRFYGATDDDKSELLKDILAFANGWKETDAHIIIGIDEKDGRAATVTGVSVHLADNDVQQFVNGKTNKAVTLAVETVPHSGVELDVIRIAQAQTRPIYCRRGFGKLREGTVYVRRGSSTAVADPDEVSAMGRTDAVAQLTTIPTLAIEFGNPDERVRFGTDHVMTSVSLLDAPTEAPRVHPRQPEYPWLGGFPASAVATSIEIVDPLAPKPQDWIRFLKRCAFLNPLGFWLNNTGTRNVTNARIEIRFPRVEGLEIVKRADGPKRPSYGVGSIEWQHIRDSLQLHMEPDAFVVEFEHERLLPKAQVWSAGLVYVGSSASVQCACDVSVFADNLANPIKTELTLRVEAIRRVYTQDELRQAKQGS